MTPFFKLQIINQGMYSATIGDFRGTAVSKNFAKFLFRDLFFIEFYILKYTLCYCKQILLYDSVSLYVVDSYFLRRWPIVVTNHAVAIAVIVIKVKTFLAQNSSIKCGKSCRHWRWRRW